MTDDTAPRILPLPSSEWTEPARDIFAMFGGPEAREKGLSNNVIETLVRNTALAKPFLSFSLYLLAQSSLPPRLRELVILRTCWNRKFEYDWRYHQAAAAQLGVTPNDVRALQQGPDAEGWTELERAALRAADQLDGGGRIDDVTWRALRDGLSEQQVMDLLFTVGGYIMTALTLDNLGVELEPGMPRGMGVTGAEDEM